MNYTRSFQTNALQVGVLLFALFDLLYGLFFALNLESLSQSFNLIINQPEDRLWREFLGIFFLMSFLSFIPALYAPMLYRFHIWVWNVIRPILMVLILIFSTVGSGGVQEGDTWISHQGFFLYMFWIFLVLALYQLLFLLLSRNEYKEAKKKGQE